MVLIQNKGRIFCPQCKSFNVKIDITASSVFGVPQNWICNDCGYSNVVFPELKEVKIKKIKNWKIKWQEAN